jgi:parallel beta-helix repeat protein
MKHDGNPKYAKLMALVTGILLLGMGMIFSQAEAFECGDILARGHHKLTENLTCSPDDGDPALTLEGGANLDLNGYTVDCNNPPGSRRYGIVLEGRNAMVRSGIITNCYNGVVISGDGHHKVSQLIVENNNREGIKVISAHNQLVHTDSRNNSRRGFLIEGDKNNLVNCLAEDNGRHGFIIDGRNDNKISNCAAFDNGYQGFLIDKGNDNKVRNSDAFNNCRDGIEIKEGNDNYLINNYVADNGNPVTCCEVFGYTYKPWFYAGIDITDGAEENTIINNRTSGNLGCDEEDCCEEEDCCDEVCCDVRERNLLDENVDTDGNCDSTNWWNNNRVDGERAEPECVAAF